MRLSLFLTTVVGICAAAAVRFFLQNYLLATLLKPAALREISPLVGILSSLLLIGFAAGACLRLYILYGKVTPQQLFMVLFLQGAFIFFYPLLLSPPPLFSFMDIREIFAYFIFSGAAVAAAVLCLGAVFGGESKQKRRFLWLLPLGLSWFIPPPLFAAMPFIGDRQAALYRLSMLWINGSALLCLFIVFFLFSLRHLNRLGRTKGDKRPNSRRPWERLTKKF